MKQCYWFCIIIINSILCSVKSGAVVTVVIYTFIWIVAASCVSVYYFVMFSSEYLEDGDTLYFMNNETNAELDGQVKEYIRFQPHYDTIIKGGLYEYYASEGQNPIRKC